MKKAVLALFFVIALSFAIVASASAAQKQWFAHTNNHGKVVCDKGNNGQYGPFSSKASCQAFADQANNPPTGWPGTSGTISGNGSGGCNGADVILTSDENEPGYGAFDFDIAPGQEFQNIGLDFNFDVLSGTQAWSEPYFIVRFTDHTQAFVYSVDVNPGQPGEQTYSLTGNTYITRNEAMAQWGEKIVSSVTLAVDNGNLSIAAHGLVNDDCPVPVVTPRTPDHVFLCTPSGAVGSWAKEQAAELVTLGYTEAHAFAGNVDGGNNVGAYHLTCDPGTFTGQFVGDGGNVYGSDYGPATEELGFYPIYS